MKLCSAILASAFLFSAQPDRALAQGASNRNEEGIVSGPETPPDGPATPSRSKRPKNASSIPAPGRHPGPAEVKTFSFSRTFGAERFSRPLIVRTGKAEPKSTVQLVEDLAVMSRIIEKTAAEYREEREEAAGIPILALGTGKAVRALYLEDYGAVFTLNVNIPLRPESKPEEPNEKRTAVPNEEWTEAHNELFGERRSRPDRAPRRAFDQHQVDAFRDALVDCLRNASNIRHLRENDWITLVVRSRASELDPDSQFDVIVRGRSGPEREALSSIQAEDLAAEPSTMVLRARKSSVDEFARDPGKLDQFKQKVSIAIY